MTTAYSPLHVLKAQADKIAATIKAAERGAGSLNVVSCSDVGQNEHTAVRGLPAPEPTRVQVQIPRFHPAQVRLWKMPGNVQGGPLRKAVG